MVQGPAMGQRRNGVGIGLIMALMVAAFSLFRYFGTTSINPVTGEKQRTGGISARQEIALGLQAAPQLIQQYGGASQDIEAQVNLENIGERLVANSAAKDSPYRYQFHLLEDDQTINAFALPGGQVFITEALLRRLKTEGQLAGVIGHEIGHVVGRHSAEQLAKQQLTQGLTGAAVLATYNPDDPSSKQTAAVAAAIGQLVNMKFGRDAELESDQMGVRFMAEAGYDPRAMIEVMQILKAAGGGRSTPEFFSTHPNPDNRVERIKAAIQNEFPNGIPAGLKR